MKIPTVLLISLKTGPLNRWISPRAYWSLNESSVRPHLTDLVKKKVCIFCGPCGCNPANDNHEPSESGKPARCKTEGGCRPRQTPRSRQARETISTEPEIQRPNFDRCRLTVFVFILFFLLVDPFFDSCFNKNSLFLQLWKAETSFFRKSAKCRF